MAKSNYTEKDFRRDMRHCLFHRKPVSLSDIIREIKPDFERASNHDMEVSIGY